MATNRTGALVSHKLAQRCFVRQRYAHDPDFMLLPARPNFNALLFPMRVMMDQCTHKSLAIHTTGPGIATLSEPRIRGFAICESSTHSLVAVGHVTSVGVHVFNTFAAAHGLAASAWALSSLVTRLYHLRLKTRTPTTDASQRRTIRTVGIMFCTRCGLIHGDTSPMRYRCASERGKSYAAQAVSLDAPGAPKRATGRKGSRTRRRAAIVPPPHSDVLRPPDKCWKVCYNPPERIAHFSPTSSLPEYALTGGGEHSKEHEASKVNLVILGDGFVLVRLMTTKFQVRERRTIRMVVCSLDTGQGSLEDDVRLVSCKNECQASVNDASMMGKQELGVGAGVTVARHDSQQHNMTGPQQLLRSPRSSFEAFPLITLYHYGACRPACPAHQSAFALGPRTRLSPDASLALLAAVYAPSGIRTSCLFCYGMAAWLVERAKDDDGESRSHAARSGVLVAAEFLGRSAELPSSTAH
ncbi:hypothetical protein EDB86DRAFT_2832442 [Lactarius hatsudake]|nr:hypothetical protein EDB86DRAFT_2832442 [Lactarius hatsudake]